MNSNINISSSLNDHATVSQSVKPVNIPQSVGSVQNVDISNKMEAKEDKSTCAIERMAANPGIDIIGAKSPVRWGLGKMVVVTNLGVNLLVGEPGKLDNKIVTISHHKIIETVDVNGKAVKLPYYPKGMKLRSEYVPCRTRRTEIIYQGHKLKYELPPDLRNSSYVNISPTRTMISPWFTCRNLKVAKDGSVDIENSTE